VVYLTTDSDFVCAHMSINEQRFKTYSVLLSARNQSLYLHFLEIICFLTMHNIYA